MSHNLLQTKLYQPRLRLNLVPRPHLIDRLNQNLQHGAKLTLISAPAGFGKTTLVTEWIAQSERPFAWLSLDQKDNDLARFLIYLIAALQSLAPNGASAAEGAPQLVGLSPESPSLELLQSAQPPPTETILTTLLNELAALPAAQPFALVLDDYHEVDDPQIDQALTFLLENLPPHVHLVITTREDPLLPLPRLRVRGLLAELRAHDLRFTAEETAEFLNQLTGLDLSAQEITVLDKRTEGWIAGLQLAAIAMQSSPALQGRPDVHQFITAFAGDDRYIVDYLVEEVLQRQPDHIRRFLLQTAILDRLSGPLCDTLTGQKESSDLLERLERSNLFVIPLDNKRSWYRYHHLFAGVLQAHLLKNQPQEVAVLHQKASDWFEQNDFTAEAVHHALVAKDFERAANLIELAWPEMSRTRQSSLWLRWVRELPEHLLRHRPILNLGYAYGLFSKGELEGGKARLQIAEESVQATPDKIVVLDKDYWRYLPAPLASARAYHALTLGDVPAGLAYAQKAYNLIPETDPQQRNRPASILALAHWAGGDLNTAARTLSNAMTSARLAGNPHFAITGAYVLAAMQKGLGRLQEAISGCRETLELAWKESDPPPRGTADIHVALSELFLEQGNLETAVHHLEEAAQLSPKSASPFCDHRLHQAQAHINAYQGQYDDALRHLDQAERRYVRGPAPQTRPIAAQKARIWLAQGNLAAAQQWLQVQGLSVDDEIDYLSEYDHITLARVLLAAYQNDRQENTQRRLIALLQRLYDSAVSQQRSAATLEILILQVLAHEAANDISVALLPLQQALVLAAPERVALPFITAGPPMARLLAQAAENKITSAYTAQLLAAMATETPTTTPETPPQPLIEPLSERELEVLQLVAQGLSNRQIAERLYLALPTIKGHNRNIYQKLNVNRRTQAVAKARKLDLL
jgi:LuxR family transcriptional regulator, maltose regulon positive regulatory protein